MPKKNKTTYGLSDGSRMTGDEIDRKVVKAKEKYLEDFVDLHGYIFCERSKRSDKPVDRSHIISVRICKQTGRSELSFSKWNLEFLTREEHLKLENWANKTRELWFEMRKEGMSFEQFEDWNKIDLGGV
ncbi:MAG: hypothetical protein Unbinned5350contig1001_41 [Prokaryotic dsDNA virus sp.]|nr:MAG: hypothetical protein Unbinned5350contig1001_41 [Prokaryotic dsDNA virus sp.]|tara:strand:- start:12069 stop:12455 length:387 start_codon:yes stop_codon:yes gene_type:complete